MSDRELLELERAAQHDPSARQALRHARIRRGVCPLDPGEVVNLLEPEQELDGHATSGFASAELTADWTLVSGSRIHGVTVRDGVTLDLLRSVAPERGAVARCQGSRVLVGGASPALFDLASPSLAPLRRFASADWVGDVALSRDGRHCALATARRLTVLSDAGVRRWAISLRNPIAVAFAPDGSQLAVACGDGGVRILDAHDGSQQRELRGPKGSARAVSYAPTGAQLLSAHGANLVLWDVASGLELQRIEAHSEAINDAALSPVARRAATASNDGTVRVWDLPTGRELQRFTRAWWVTSVRYGPRGHALVFSYFDRHPVHTSDGSTMALPAAIDVVGLELG